MKLLRKYQRGPGAPCGRRDPPLAGWPCCRRGRFRPSSPDSPAVRDYLKQTRRAFPHDDHDDDDVREGMFPSARRLSRWRSLAARPRHETVYLDVRAQVFSREKLGSSLSRGGRDHRVSPIGTRWISFGNHRGLRTWSRSRWIVAGSLVHRVRDSLSHGQNPTLRKSKNSQFRIPKRSRGAASARGPPRRARACPS